MDLKQKLGFLWVYRWEAQNIHRGKKVFWKGIEFIELLLDVLKPLFKCTKKAPCKTTHSSFISFYSEIISACPRARRLLMDLNAVQQYSTGNTGGSQGSGRLPELGRVTWVGALLHVGLAWWLVPGIKWDHYVSSWRPDPISIKTMEIFLPASTNAISVLGDVPFWNSGFASVSGMHWKGLYISNLPSGLIHCFTLQFINILRVIQVLFASKKEKEPENIQECSFCKTEINVCM